MSLPNAITVIVKFDRRLKEITKQDSFESTVSEGLFFTHFLYFLFQSYPDIEKKYPPGTLAMTVNNLPPVDFQPLEDGDVISFWIPLQKIN